jgi:hypothetical protein
VDALKPVSVRGAPGGKRLPVAPRCAVLPPHDDQARTIVPAAAVAFGYPTQIGRFEVGLGGIEHRRITAQSLVHDDQSQSPKSIRSRGIGAVDAAYLPVAVEYIEVTAIPVLSWAAELGAA